MSSSTVSEWSVGRYVAPLEKFDVFLRYFPATEHERLRRLRTAAQQAEQRASAKDAAAAASDEDGFAFDTSKVEPQPGVKASRPGLRPDPQAAVAPFAPVGESHELPTSGGQNVPAPGSAGDLRSAAARHNGHRPPSGPVEADAARLSKVADVLADVARQHWEQIADNSRLRFPRPIPVPWRRSTRPVAGPVEEAVADPAARGRFAAIPGTALATVANVQAGRVEDLPAVYRGLASGRIFILGQPGTGKTGTSILMLLDELDYRARLDDAQRPLAPVPVLLTASDWDPLHQRLGAWLADRLISEYRVPPADAVRLVETGLVALVLDGFDEIDEQLRPAAVEAIDRQATFRVVVFTRSDEFTKAVASGHVHGAVAFELQPVPATDAADYLTRCTVDPPPAPWQRLISHLRQHQDSELAAALSSPLMLGLVRDGFPDPADIDELLASNRFSARCEIEDYLLDRVLPTAYRPRPDKPPIVGLDQARRYLGFLAAQMNKQKTRSLAWWQMHHWAPRTPRILAAAVLGAFVTGLVDAVVFGPLGQYTVRGHTGGVFGLAYGSLVGLGFGLVTGLVSEFRKPSPDRPGRVRWDATRSSRFNGSVGLLLGFVVTVAVGNQTNYLNGLASGLAVGCTAGFAAMRARPDPPQASRSRLRRLRARLDLTVGLTAGLPVGLAYGLTNGLAHGLGAGLVSLLTFGSIVGMSKASMTGPTIPTHPLGSWRHDIHRGITYGLLTGLPLGLSLGTVNGIAHGAIPGLVAGIGFASIIALASFVGVSDAWRTTLVFLQLHRRGVFPTRGMRFLEDAYERHVLRKVGPRYEVRHRRLQDRLTDTDH